MVFVDGSAESYEGQSGMEDVIYMSRKKNVGNVGSKKKTSANSGRKKDRQVWVEKNAGKPAIAGELTGL